jgi:hypothetical protein
MIVAVALFLVCVPWIAKAEPLQDENLLVSVPADWERVTGGRKGNMSISEYVPKGETVDNWTQMITVQILHEAGHVAPKKFVDEMGKGVKEQTRKGMGTIETLDMAEYSEYPSFAVMWAMGELKATGKGEITLIRAFQGKDALYIVQKAWRRPAFDPSKELPVSDQELKDGMLFLMKANVVDARKTDTSKTHVDVQSNYPPSDQKPEKGKPEKGTSLIFAQKAVTAPSFCCAVCGAILPLSQWGNKRDVAGTHS